MSRPSWVSQFSTARRLIRLLLTINPVTPSASPWSRWDHSGSNEYERTSSSGGTITENFVEIIRTDKVRPFLSIQRLLNILVYRKYPASRSIRIGLLGLVFIRHDEEATTRPWANIISNISNKMYIYPSENYWNNVYLICSQIIRVQPSKWTPVDFCLQKRFTKCLTSKYTSEILTIAKYLWGIWNYQ